IVLCPSNGLCYLSSPNWRGGKATVFPKRWNGKKPFHPITTKSPSMQPKEKGSEKKPPPPDYPQWAQQQLPEGADAAGPPELREKGGLELQEFLQELEQMVARQ